MYVEEEEERKGRDKKNKMYSAHNMLYLFSELVLAISELAQRIIAFGLYGKSSANKNISHKKKGECSYQKRGRKLLCVIDLAFCLCTYYIPCISRTPVKEIEIELADSGSPIGNTRIPEAQQYFLVVIEVVLNKFLQLQPFLSQSWPKWSYNLKSAASSSSPPRRTQHPPTIIM